MTKFDIAAVGDNCIDRFAGTETFSLVGGNAVNVAVQLSLLGRKSAYFGAVGNDDDGARTVQLLAQNGVNVEFVRTVAGMTAYTEVERYTNGDRRFVFEEFGVVRDYRPDAQDLEALYAARHVHIGWLNDWGALRKALSRRGTSVSQDISVNADRRNQGVAGLEIAFASSDGRDDEVRDLAEELLEAGAEMAVITRGEKGSFATDGKNTASIDAVKIEPLDTTGAGDAFIAGFLNARLSGKPLDLCLAAGREVATAACLHLGGFPQRALSN